MGQLVFQATLGGQVNLVGPNTASTFNINVPATSGNMVTTGDTGTVTATMLASTTGSGAVVLATSPTLVTPALGTPSALVGTNITGTAAGLSIGGNAATATTATNVSGGTSSVTSETVSGNLTLSGGTANGVAYLNGSKVVTTGSALTFDGAILGVNGVSVGRGAGAVATNTAVGSQALNANTTASNNTAVGYQAAYSNTTASNNTAVGYQALYSNQTGSYNTALGYQAFYAATGSAGNAQYGIAIGYQAAKNLTTGNAVLAIGAGCAPTLTTGSNGLYIGAAADASSASVSQEMAIIATNGASIAGKGTNTGFIAVNTGGSYGSIYQGNNSTLWAITSDERIKENVATLQNGLQTIMALRPVEFNYIETKKHDVSFIAQEYQKILPEQVKEHAASAAEKEITGVDTLLGVTPNLVPYLVKAVQEQQALINSLTTRLAALEAK